MYKLFHIISFNLLFVCFAYKSLAWGTTGHRVVAEIAERNLNSKAKKNLYKLIGKQKMAFYANWADNLRSDTTDKWKHTTGGWHYINLPSGLSTQAFYDSVRNYKKENVYSQIPLLENKIKDKSLSVDERKSYLAFLIHFMGDLHQPMHVAKAEDLGGNKISVNWFGKPSNLHQVWDSDMIDFQKWSYTEYATVLNVISDNEKKAIQKGPMLNWLYESYVFTNEIYARTPFGANLSYNYVYIFTDKMNYQLLKAGIRLAKILNEIL